MSLKILFLIFIIYVVICIFAGKNPKNKSASGINKPLLFASFLPAIFFAILYSTVFIYFRNFMGQSKSIGEAIGEAWEQFWWTIFDWPLALVFVPCVGYQIWCLVKSITYKMNQKKTNEKE